MRVLILLPALTFIGAAFAQSESFDKAVKKALSSNYLHEKRQLAVRQQGRKIIGAILQYDVKELKRLRKEHRGLKLISWPSEKWLINKNVSQLFQEEKI